MYGEEERWESKSRANEGQESAGAVDPVRWMGRAPPFDRVSVSPFWLWDTGAQTGAFLQGRPARVDDSKAPRHGGNGEDLTVSGGARE